MRDRFAQREKRIVRTVPFLWFRFFLYFLFIFPVQAFHPPHPLDIKDLFCITNPRVAFLARAFFLFFLFWFGFFSPVLLLWRKRSVGMLLWRTLCDRSFQLACLSLLYDVRREGYKYTAKIPSSPAFTEHLSHGCYDYKLPTSCGSLWRLAVQVLWVLPTRWRLIKNPLPFPRSPFKPTRQRWDSLVSTWAWLGKVELSACSTAMLASVSAAVTCLLVKHVAELKSTQRCSDPDHTPEARIATAHAYVAYQEWENKVFIHLFVV